MKNNIKNMPLKRKIFVCLAFLGLGIGIYKWKSTSGNPKVTYETTKVEKGTLTSLISGSGAITAGNYTSLSTKVSGVVASVYVTNGDKITKGQKIATVMLDEYGKERETSTWLDYLKTKEAAQQAQTDKVQADIEMWKIRQELLDAQDKYNNNTGNNETERQTIIKTLELKRRAFTVAESKYLNADANIANSKAQVAAALRDYQQNSATIVAPVSGIISDLALAPGLTINANTSTSNTSGATIVSAQTIGKISNPAGKLLSTINLSEVDVLKVQPNQKVILTLDAYPDKTFSGKVLSVNTVGEVSSGVTSYPVTIILDSVNLPIYTNMAVSVQIITSILTDVLKVPTTAITTGNNGYSIQVKKNNQISSVEVEVGRSNDSETEIVSGLSEGDEVVTATIDNSKRQTTSTNTSPFNGLNRTNSSSNRTGGNNRVFIGGPGF